MGPFSNNTPPPKPPTAPNNGTKLPIPDVEGTPQSFVVAVEPDNSLATRKWFTITMIIAGIMATAGLIVFLIYLFVSNTSSYVLNAAMQNLVNSDGEAGTIRYETKQGGKTTILNGTFLTFTDPTNRMISSTTVSFGPSEGRLSATNRLFPDGNYVQTAGLANLKRLVESVGGNGAIFTPDRLTRMSVLDGQWYSFAADDVFDLRDMLPGQVQGNFTSKDIETIRQLYLKHPFLTAAQHLSDESIDGASTMHLRIGFDQKKLGDFLADLKSSNMQALQLSDNDLKALQGGQAFGLDKATIEVWIAHSDRTFRQIRVAYLESTTTITFHSEQVAAQRQSVIRPESAKSAASFVRGIQEILTSPSSPPVAQ